MDEALLQTRLAKAALLRGYGIHVLLFLCAVTLGLWEHGHAALTLSLLPTALFLAALHLLPRRWIPQLACYVIQGIIGTAAAAWTWFRFTQKAPADMLLVEALAILGLAFLLPRNQRELRLFFFICLLLGGYGTLLPVRTIPVVLMPVGAGLMLWILYTTASEEQVLTEIKDPRRTSPRWLLAGRTVLHILLLVVLWTAVRSIMPAPMAPVAGVSPVSFLSGNPVAPTFGNWLRGRRLVLNPEADAETPAGWFPTSQGGTQQVENQADTEQTMSANGSGGKPGKDLVMRVRSPLKLYWLGRIYDVCDGEVWSCSKELKKQRLMIGRRSYVPDTLLVKQEFIIEKWVSPTVFSAYIPYGMPFSNLVRFRPFYAMNEVVVRPGESPPSVPFIYTISSLVPGLLARHELVALAGTWTETLPKKHYLQLPADKTTTRLQDLATSITKGATADLAKATLLRDYLRTFEYSMDTTAPPAGTNSLEYFLFETRTGHCEYFAAAMTQLARVAGLPARVCTGYAPGDYNPVTGYFEVREYHAHAWSQVFINGQGWLTMDATPSSATPFQPSLQAKLLGSLQDPFSDEWRIRTPEQNAAVTKLRLDRMAATMAAAVAAKAENKTAGHLPTPGPGQTSRKHGRHPGAAGTPPLPATPDMMAASEAADYDQNLSLPDLAAKHLKKLLQNLRSKIRLLGPYCTFDALMASLMVVIMVFLAVYIAPGVRIAVNQRRLWFQAERWLHRARQAADASPQASITFSFFAIRDFLEFLGWREARAEDLMEYAARIYRHSKTLGRDVEGVFLLYVRRRYSEDPIGPAEATAAVERATLVRQLIVDAGKKRAAARAASGTPQ